MNTLVPTLARQNEDLSYVIYLLRNGLRFENCILILKTELNSGNKSRDIYLLLIISYINQISSFFLSSYASKFLKQDEEKYKLLLKMFNENKSNKKPEPPIVITIDDKKEYKFNSSQLLYKVNEIKELCSVYFIELEKLSKNDLEKSEFLNLKNYYHYVFSVTEEFIKKSNSRWSDFVMSMELNTEIINSYKKNITIKISKEDKKNLADFMIPPGSIFYTTISKEVLKNADSALKFYSESSDIWRSDLSVHKKLILLSFHYDISKYFNIKEIWRRYTSLSANAFAFYENAVFACIKKEKETKILDFLEEGNALNKCEITSHHIGTHRLLRFSKEALGNKIIMHNKNFFKNDFVQCLSQNMFFNFSDNKIKNEIIFLFKLNLSRNIVCENEYTGMLLSNQLLSELIYLRSNKKFINNEELVYYEKDINDLFSSQKKYVDSTYSTSIK